MGPALPSGDAPKLLRRMRAYRPTAEVQEALKKSQLEGYWVSAHARITSDALLDAVLGPACDEIGEPAQAIARAIVAEMILRRFRDDLPVIAADRRDNLVHLLSKNWADVAGVGNFLLNYFAGYAASALTPVIKWKRNDLSGAASPGAGDVLMYQARGERIRDYISNAVKGIDDDVLLLAHSLGGIACFDLLVQNGGSAPLNEKVRGLITVASQAPLLCEIGASVSMPPGSSLPAHFPPWLNLYDPYDFLSYLAKPVFNSDRITDKCIESGQPFPQSHSAYWALKDTWKFISEFMNNVCPPTPKQPM
jgi:hypothetical protein